MITRGLKVANSRSNASILLFGIFAILVDGFAKMLVSNISGTDALKRSIRRRVSQVPLPLSARSAL
jgi:hypothetical protein